MKTIYKNRHYNGLIPFPDGIHFGEEYMEFEFMFAHNCKYDLKGPDQLDWNKLFGLSWGMPHRESARFAWRYNPDSDLIEIAAYPYVRRISQYGAANSVQGSTIADKRFKIGEVEPGKTHKGIIDATGGKQLYILGGQDFYEQPYSYHRGPGFILGPYFGGSPKAPHRMDFNIKRIRLSR